MYKSSPAFSIKGKYNQNHLDIKPSPFQYNVQNWNLKKTPSWKQYHPSYQRIGTDKKSKNIPNQNPGPGQYQSPHASRCNKFGIIGKQNKRAETPADKSPSPTSYSPVMIDKGPSISFSKKYQITNKQIYNPGPGTYQQTATSKLAQGHGTPIGKEKRFAQQKQQKFIPGPGSYDYKRPSSAKVSFGREVRQCGKKLNTSIEPGPGQYQKKSLFDQSTKSCKGFSICGKIVTKDFTVAPGPANYDPNFTKIYTSIPSFSMCKKNKQTKPDQSPSPHSYNPKDIYQSLHISFFKAERKPLLNNKDIPGPGEYQPFKQFKSSPKFSLGVSRKTEAKLDSPGPGAYEPNKNVVKSRPQSAKIGKSKKFDDKKQLSPGPGQYQFYKKSRPTTPNCIFGRDSRMKQSVNVSPGPGQYAIPSTVGYTAPYAFK